MKKIAVYAGTFDPITFGHLDIIHRACAIFPKIIVAVVNNPQKNTLFSIKERVEMIRNNVGDNPNINIQSFTGLLADFMKFNKSDVIIRGLRAVSDFEYEFQLALTNRKISADIDTIFLMPSEEYTYLSSSIVKQLASVGGDISLFVPENVKQAFTKKYIKEKK